MSEEKVFSTGGVELHVDNRTLGEDGGPAVRVYGDVDGKSVQLLRFDCFRKNPHYHYDPSGKTIIALSTQLRSLIRSGGRWSNLVTISLR